MRFFEPVLASVVARWAPCVSVADPRGCESACRQYEWCEGYSSAPSCYLTGTPREPACGTNVTLVHAAAWSLRNGSHTSVGCFHGVCYVDDSYGDFPITDAAGPRVTIVSNAVSGDRVLVNRTRYFEFYGAAFGTIYARDSKVYAPGSTVVISGPATANVTANSVVVAGAAGAPPIVVDVVVKVSYAIRTAAMD